jgi:integrase/recombinase XerD
VTDQTLARPQDLALDRDELVASGFLVTFKQPTRGSYQTSLKAWFQWCTAMNVAPLRAQRAHIELWMRELEEHGNRHAVRGPKPLMASTINGMLNAVVGFYKFAQRDGYITDDITSYLKRPKVPNESRREGLTRFELKACLDTAKRNPLEYALWCLLAFNGFRIGEVTPLNVDDLGHHQGYRTLKVRREKGNRGGFIPLAPVTSHAIDRYLGTRTTGPLFLMPRIEQRLDDKASNRIIKRVARDAGVTKTISNHSLRHTHITLALNEGVGMRDLTNSMGYADGRQIARYDRDKSSMARSATWAVAGALEGF